MTLSTPAFLASLTSLGLTPTTFAAESGADPKSARAWAAGDAPVPRWVPRMLELLALPGAMAPPAALGRARTGDGRFTPTPHAPGASKALSPRPAPSRPTPTETHAP